MSAIEWMGPAVVGAGLGVVAMGALTRSLAHRTSSMALQTIVGEGLDSREAELSQPLAQRMLGPAWESFAKGARAVTPTTMVTRLRRNIALAGLGGIGVEGILAMKAAAGVLMALGVPAVMALLGVHLGKLLLWGLLGGIFGFMVPDIIIAHQAEDRQAKIRKTLPETLDLLAIAVGAGMGLEAAIELVIQRLPGPLGDEFHRLLQELALGVSRREAFGNLRERTEVDELSTFALIITQADALGTPLTLVLRSQAAEMRALRRQRAREQGAKTPVTLLFPLLLGIFPALMLIVAGPAVIGIMHAFSGGHL
ncbi:MAG TPA: type II secretion system F family protein [Actinomycetota bacterium]|nr:type II secretion system F family protein [Actinomycetota bacterium]